MTKNKEKEQDYLVIITKYFIDPHGSADEGGIEKRIISGPKADKLYQEYRDALKEEKNYIQYDEWVTSEDLHPSEDGYNAKCEGYEIKKISSEKAEEYREILKQYNKIK